MSSPLRRALGAATCLATLALTMGIAGAPPAGAQTPGPGASSGQGSLLSVDLGPLLQLKILGEDGAATIDPADGTPTAFTRLRSLDVSSQVLPALDALTVPLAESRSTGAENTLTTSLLDLGGLTAQLIPGVLGGAINPATLTSHVDAVTGARSGLGASLAQLDVLGGLVSSGTAGLDLGGTGAVGAATVTRGISVDEIALVDLGGILELLGVSLSDLPLDTLIGLVDQLGVLGPVSQATGIDLASITDLNDAASAIVGGLAGASSLLASGVCDGAQPVLDLLGNLIGTPVTCDALGLQAAIDQLGVQLSGLLQGILSTLQDTALVTVDALSAGVSTVAAPSVEASSATTSGGIGGISIAGVDLGAIDLNATVDQLVALAQSAAAQVNGILASISPQLGNLLSFAFFERSTSVAMDDAGIVRAIADITALRITVTPPDICALLTDLDPSRTAAGLLEAVGSAAATVGPLNDLLGSLGSTLTCGAGGSTAGGGLLDGVATALTSPLSVKVASVGGVSRVALPAAPAVPSAPEAPAQAPTPPLPRTGLDHQLLLALAATAVLAALGSRRLLHATTRRPR